MYSRAHDRETARYWPFAAGFRACGRRPTCTGVCARRERKVGDGPVVDDVQVHDRRRAKVSELVRVRDARPRARGPPRRRAEREDDRVRVHALPVPGEPEGARPALDAFDARPNADVDAGALGAPGRPCRRAAPAADGRVADVPGWPIRAGRSGIPGRSASGASAAGRLTVEDDQVPECVDGGLDWPRVAQPRAEDPAGRAPGRRGRARQRADGARDPDAVAAREIGEARSEGRDARGGEPRALSPGYAAPRARQPGSKPALQLGRRVASMRSRKRRYAVQQRRNTCWPLSIQIPSRRNRERAPPRRGLPSSSVTSAPASAHSSAAAIPARPPPTSGDLHGATAARLRDGDPALLPGSGARRGRAAPGRAAARSGRAAAGRSRPSPRRRRRSVGRGGAAASDPIRTRRSPGRPRSGSGHDAVVGRERSQPNRSRSSDGR